MDLVNNLFLWCITHLKFPMRKNSKSFFGTCTCLPVTESNKRNWSFIPNFKPTVLCPYCESHWRYPKIISNKSTLYITYSRTCSSADEINIIMYIQSKYIHVWHSCLLIYWPLFNGERTLGFNEWEYTGYKGLVCWYIDIQYLYSSIASHFTNNLSYTI